MKMKTWKYKVTEIAHEDTHIVLTIKLRKVYICLLVLQILFRSVFDSKIEKNDES